MKIRVFGTAQVTVSTVIDIDLNEADLLNPDIGDEIYGEADGQFQGITSFVGNGGMDKLIGVNSESDTIAADADVVWDDYQWEED